LEFALSCCAQIYKICVGKGEVPNAAIVHVGGDDDELIGIFVGKRTQQDSISNTKDRGARADAQSDGERRSERKDRTIPQRSPCECQIS
jgi:hypothetical protein